MNVDKSCRCEIGHLLYIHCTMTVSIVLSRTFLLHFEEGRVDMAVVGSECRSLLWQEDDLRRT